MQDIVMSNFNIGPSGPGNSSMGSPRVKLSRISDLLQKSQGSNQKQTSSLPLSVPASTLSYQHTPKPSSSPTNNSALNLSRPNQGSSRPTLANPGQLFDRLPAQAPSSIKPIHSPKSYKSPNFIQAGHQISSVAERSGYTRGQVINDKTVIRAMMNQAGQLYNIPGDFLYRTAIRESGAKHWDKQNKVRSAAAVGIMQIEKSAHPKETKTGAVDALNNAFDLGNNIALGARNLSRSIKRLARQTGYTGSQEFQDLAPLLNISYNAGSGALNKVMNKARKMGLNPFNWQHLAFGRNVAVPAGGKFNVPQDWIETAPLHLALKEIHDSRAAKGVHNYPIYWKDAANLKRHDFDQSGTATRSERLIARIIYTMTGKTLKAQ